MSRPANFFLLSGIIFCAHILNASVLNAGALSAESPEPDYFSEQLASGKLPPMAQRVPENPLLMDETMNNLMPGTYGGKMNLLMGKDKDIRRMVVYGYSRIVGYNESLELIPDIVESFEVHDNKEFIFHLRKGHRWSDGAPLTSEDFKYYWEDVANNPELNPFGPSKKLLIDEQLPVVEFPDAYTVIYRWQQPNPYFLPALAAPSPLFIYQPKHYLTKFHPRYADPQKLEAQAKQSGKRNWAGYYLKKARQYKLTNPKLPSLQPWVNTTKPPAERYVFKRNPYFHRVDVNGLQMPYIDEVIINIVSSSLIPAKSGAGESDLQGHYLRLDNYTFLKEGEKRNDYDVRLWRNINGAHKALYPNLNSSDLVWRELVRDTRFRRALSLGVDRHEINQAVYFGLTNESNNTVLPDSKFHNIDLQRRWAVYDPERANRLLDEMGLTERNSKGLRLRPDRKPLEIIIHSAGESTEETDILELIHDSWLKLGIKIYSKPSQRQVFRERIFSGEAMMSIWSGIENGLPTADMSPAELAPTRQDQYQWPKWGQYYETKGEIGETPDMKEVQELFELNQSWRRSIDLSEREQIWTKMLKNFCEQVYSIGIVNSVPQPIVVNRLLRNVPEKAIYAWSPTSYFGVYHPDIFWFATEQQAK
ncbi:ABC transporter substrate-binding protein [Candidatus Spongiihabitans sp.]|uniref:ABC transporter substrate-binding protein n=1 Tax=Candidatus Spongiihabitans sp. TaxID=3101308 RepID=UPI003C6F4063